jgi:hypothetical protein
VSWFVDDIMAAKKRSKKAKGKRLRKAGTVTQAMEPLLLELVDHGLQHGEILNLVRGYLEIHCPGAREEYLDGTSPEFYYGPRRDT